MGGYGALLAAERAVKPTGDSFFKGVAGAEDFYANDVFMGVDALRSLSVRLDCGTLDPFYQATHQLSELMT